MNATTKMIMMDLDRDAMTMALRALYASSPHTDAKYNWQEPEWTKQRTEAIQALEARLLPLEPKTEPDSVKEEKP